MELSGHHLRHGREKAAATGVWRSWTLLHIAVAFVRVVCCVYKRIVRRLWSKKAHKRIERFLHGQLWLKNRGAVRRAFAALFRITLSGFQGLLLVRMRMYLSIVPAPCSLCLLCTMQRFTDANLVASVRHCRPERLRAHADRYCHSVSHYAHI